jgi:hypothetical protein
MNSKIFLFKKVEFKNESKKFSKKEFHILFKLIFLDLKIVRSDFKLNFVKI